MHPGVGHHRLDHLPGLVGHRLQRGPGDVRLGHVPGQPDQRAAGVRTPVGREQSGERRHQVRPAVVLDRGRERLDLGRRGDQPEVVAQPLHQRPGDRDRALQGVHRRLPADLVADRGQQSVGAGHLQRPGVHQEEVPGAVGVLARARLEADLSERGRLLVAEHPGDRHPVEHPGATPELARGGQDLRQHRHRHTHLGRDRRVPAQGVQVHQHRPAGVGHVGQVHPAGDPAGEVPDQPAVHGAEQQVAALGVRPGAGHLVQDPARLRPGEVGGQRQPHPRLVPRGATPERAEGLAQRRGAGVLPHDRVVVPGARCAGPRPGSSRAGW